MLYQLVTPEDITLLNVAFPVTVLQKIIYGTPNGGIVKAGIRIEQEHNFRVPSTYRWGPMSTRWQENWSSSYTGIGYN